MRGFHEGTEFFTGCDLLPGDLPVKNEALEQSLN